MKLKDKIEQITNDCEKEMQEYLEYTQLGTIFNLLEDGIDELGNNKISELWQQIQTIIQDKRKELFEIEISKKPKKKRSEG